MSNDALQLEWLSGATLHDKYKLGRQLGEGGMGAVFLAEHVGIGRAVALKVVHPDLLADPSATERFVREARAAGGIQHRHVVNVTDFGVDRVAGRDVAYLVMEQLHGETLEAVLEHRGRLPLPLVVDIVEQISAALAAAHARGVVHRDLKPANIWLSPDARGGFHVTLLDFGIAKLRDDGFARREPPQSGTTDGEGDTTASTNGRTATATQVGESIGTPAYMSPEQCVGDAIDGRSDLYSLGIVVYQMLAGTLPFRGDTRALLRQHFVAEVPPFPPEANVSPAVETVVRRALAKDPTDRLTTAPAFAAALRAQASDFGESMRRAIIMFGERFSELFPLGVCFALPGLMATGVAVLGSQLLGLLSLPLLLLLPMVAMLLATPVAMAGIAAVFGDLRGRPFARISWRDVARAVSGDAKSDVVRGDVALYLAWVRTAVSKYFVTARATKGSGLKNMIAFVDLFRHGGTQSRPDRLEAMAVALPTRAFATMAFVQLGALLLLPAAAVFSTLGVASLFSVSLSRVSPVLVLVGGLAFTVALFLQVFIALVDVMLYDLAYDMTAA